MESALNAVMRFMETEGQSATARLIVEQLNCIENQLKINNKWIKACSIQDSQIQELLLKINQQKEIIELLKEQNKK